MDVVSLSDLTFKLHRINVQMQMATLLSQKGGCERTHLLEKKEHLTWEKKKIGSYFLQKKNSLNFLCWRKLYVSSVE